MKIFFNKIKNNILICDLIFIGFNILINFILYLLNIRMRLWLIVLIVLISIVGFIVGIFQKIYNSVENKIKAIIIFLMGITPVIIFIFVLMPYISFIIAFSYHPEHTVKLDNKTYVAVVNSFLHVDVDYYDYYGPLLMGTKIKVHGYFGKGGYDPFINPNTYDSVEYTYYYDNGKIKSRKNVTFIKDESGNIKDIDSNDVDIDISDKINENENYILPENEKVLYEKKFNKTILRFAKIDEILGQNILVNVLKSTDNGKNFYVVSDEEIQVSNDAKFVFLNENIGFVSVSDKIYLNSNKENLYVTNDGGKTFTSSIFKYENKNVDYISIKRVPYYEENSLKIDCLVYQVNSSKSGYEDKKITFVSNNNGLTWFLK